MTYGEPSIKSAMQRLSTQQVDNFIVFPLYPQYSSSTTGAVFDAFAQVLKTQRGVLPFDFIHSYHTNEDYIAALVTTIQEHFQPDEFCYSLSMAFLCVMKIWGLLPRAL